MGQSQSATLQSVGQTVTNTSNEVYMGMGQMCTYRRAPRPEAASDKGAEQHPSVLFGALAYADPLDLVSAFVQARELEVGLLCRAPLIPRLMEDCSPTATPSWLVEAAG